MLTPDEEARLRALMAMFVNWQITQAGGSRVGVETVFPWNVPFQVGTLLPMAFRGECDNTQPSADAQHAIVGFSATCPSSPMNAGLVGAAAKNQTGPNAGAFLLSWKRASETVTPCLIGRQVNEDTGGFLAEFTQGPQGIAITPGSGPLPSWIVDFYGWKLIIEPPRLWWENPAGARQLVKEG